MKIVIFGLTISSSWGNGHATIWRGLCRALVRRGHHIVFFEKDVSYYAQNRDMSQMEGVDIVLYPEWDGILSKAGMELSESDVAMVTSYCPDGIAASELVIASGVRHRIFYDLDTPVTLKALREGRDVPYIDTRRGLGEFDLVLSYTGGAALKELKERLNAKEALPLYGCVDPEIHRPVSPVEAYRCDFSYLGTYASDRQQMLVELFLKPARVLKEKRFIIGGSMYPEDFPWENNIWYLAHIAPPDHPAFYCSSLFTLNITRGAMAENGYCPSGRLFEAAACGTPIISDEWTGLDYFFEPGKEIIVAKSCEDVVKCFSMTNEERSIISRAARERIFKEHTADKRALEFESILLLNLNHNLNLEKRLRL